MHVVEQLEGDQGVIRDETTANKGTLTLGDHTWEYGFQSIRDNLGDHFVDDIAKADWPKLR